MTEPQQLTLDLPQRVCHSRAAFLVAPSNAEAVAMVDAWRTWPDGRAALVGPSRAGKSHLAEVWAQETGGTIYAATDLGMGDWQGPMLLEDVDDLATLPDPSRRAAETAFFHLYTRQSAEHWPLLLTGGSEPARWPILLPDLASRLATLPLARIELPDDVLLSSLMFKLFADRQLAVEPSVIAYLVKRMERSCEAADRLVTDLDHAALQLKRPVTVPFVREIMGWT
ncbi:MAG: chromosomal replication initiator DnaA [Pseudomonadota bacterium]